VGEEDVENILIEIERRKLKKKNPSNNNDSSSSGNEVDNGKIMLQVQKKEIISIREKFAIKYEILSSNLKRISSELRY
jgi:hypothetical protein